MVKQSGTFSIETQNIFMKAIIVAADEVLFLLEEEPTAQIEPFEVTSKDIASRPLSLSLGSTPDITLFAEFLLLREVFYSYVFSFMRTKLD